MEVSELEKARYEYRPKLPAVFDNHGPFAAVSEGKATSSAGAADSIKQLFPNSFGAPVVSFTDKKDQKEIPPQKVAVIFSGGQAPGGHNVIAGLYDALAAMNSKSELYGFKGGPSGLIDNDYIHLTKDVVHGYINTGGFDLIGSGRTKLEKKDQFDKVAENCNKLGINAVVIIGGDDSNTNAGMLAEYFQENNIDIRVIGCPKTIDGDLKNQQIEASFGFDTATKVYSELIGNIARDTDSARKYWHFIRVMGRSASHIALECALQTHPNATIISEEVAEKKQTLQQIAEQIATVVKKRSDAGMDYGVCVLPEGLIEFIPEIKTLIGELNDVLADNNDKVSQMSSASECIDFVRQKLSSTAAGTFDSLPSNIQAQLLADRDPHGNVQVSAIETEKLLIQMVDETLKGWKKEGKFDGKFKSQQHFFGYEGRCAPPSNFDADYCFSLGYTAACLIASGHTGYMAAVNNLDKPAKEWTAGGVPLTMMMTIERRKGEEIPVIEKSLVELDSGPFKFFAKNRDAWGAENHFLYPGPIQYFGPPEVADQPVKTLQLEKQG